MKENQTEKVKRKPLSAAFLFIIGTPLLFLMFMLSISVGAADINLQTVWASLFSYDSSNNQHVIIQELRLPRSTADVVVGAAFAVAGAVLQGMTRNPLAETGIFGINAGSIFMVAVCFAFFPGMSYSNLILFSFAGAAMSLSMIFGIGAMTKGGLSPVRLVLAGAAISALFTALSEGIAIYYDLSQDLAFWYAGGVAGVRWEQLLPALPWLAAGLGMAVLLSRSITLLSLGEDIAAGLGARVRWIKLGCVIAVLILGGLAVSIVGPVAFVGLVIPHIVRYFVGADYQLIIPGSIIVGGIFMTMADIGARMINPPYETPIGALFALIGVPFFLYIARKERRESL
ncbi:iron ABC transporter permease [Sinobaca sp. H24]|uniref:FecCD family ABC transporter permease n=1 Tax=Sinobaca sp. H24 TaxID=2923376 RepID=UPI00207994C2|nr:iron ABC transporter permease [Sinobaca sp. H24]